MKLAERPLVRDCFRMLFVSTFTFVSMLSYARADWSIKSLAANFHIRCCHVVITGDGEMDEIRKLSVNKVKQYTVNGVFNCEKING